MRVMYVAMWNIPHMYIGTFIRIFVVNIVHLQCIELFET